ncbi:MAG: CHAT domain-containing protein [Microcoleus sp. PH2017_25_DOB_D_A]|uniref:CHAT domain-containing protein n=1 Tax=unclassified Microcoleus TaxID=2642155 RepID=UPI001D624BF8|nr:MULTISPECIES: CHAT domain-containing protein [unclassified Microcoleus]TAE08113.1 MAG: CHAT domain-containing protein [Oscillatoriales cyanobacterium]MCC3494755.1 CHAT domain-containing protein [Microcoleus sp. PH2017_16_JOR_D_A]MCC3537095.1 CHAT domain-containing protein [Microcoleus sp. PH2017_25_DOB_D_A]MCC3550869.1 CHAT domain-containing protein [Microcoleus sp. PH2017_24_DOB_U_A]TAE29298.1 MAG: CHAT domain-containing protein [Oscillatoriales cyanobacterium]
MEENRAQAYLQLIHTLLNCPNGDEPQILQDNSELLDRGFLETCESVAAKLAAQGGENGANFLRNLASQLGQFIDMNDDGDSNNSQGENPQEYANFILDLLQTEAASKGDIKVIYPMLAQRQHLLNARFAEILQKVAEKLLDGENAETISSIVALIENLSVHIIEFPRGNRANNIEIAITGYQILLSNQEPESEKFAQTQNNLANAYNQRINGSRAENLERAVSFYEAVLTVYTFEDFPQQWAITQNNLAIAYKNRINGSWADNLERAISFFDAALTVCTLEDFPEQWATTQNNLAAAYSNRINGSRAENLELAINFSDAALTIYTLEDFPEQWAETQNNLATTYSDRIKGSRADNLERAITFYENALTVHTLEDFPEYWAMTQNNLANAYLYRINGSWAENLERAITFYEAALTVHTLEDFPEYWAMTQNNLANAYSNRINGSRAENLEWAIAFYEAALTVHTLEDFPEYWAMTQNNLAAAYSNRIKGSRAQNLERAITFYNAALTIRTLEDFPLENAETLGNLGLAYLQKLDNINREKPEDTNQKAATLESAYDTFKNAIIRASKLRELESGDETKQKHDLEWDDLYRGMVQVCLDRQSNQEALLYAEANKARNLAEVIAQKQETPQLLKPITFTEITQLLTPDTALIEWYITDKEIITFVITYPDVLTVHRNPQCDELINLVNDYRADYKQSKTHWQTKLSDYLQRLAEILQITTILPSESTRLILIPHWLLHLFPLHALPLTDDEFLLDRFTQGIQYSPSCQLLQQITIHPNFDQLLALQNPTSDLPYTDLEVASIAPKFAISQILPGSEASKTNLLEQYLEQLENAHCAHFSCHGSFNPDEPLKSFLILSGGIIEDLGASERYVEWREGKTADIDKCLTLAEIFGLRFKQCRLVVLSACETALIDTQNRSDYIGLPTGFLYAGAMGTLASLWAVNDLSTALMMVKFYEVLQPGVSIGQALHDTQRWFKSAITSDLLEWVEGSESFDGDQKEGVTEYLGRYKPTVKPYGDVYHWGAFCAIGL